LAKSYQRKSSEEQRMSIPTPSELYPVIIDEIRAHGSKARLRDLCSAIAKRFPQLTSTDL